jgi:hypothetical protein
MQAFAIEQGYNIRFVSRIKKKVGGAAGSIPNSLRAENISGHGGRRIAGVHGQQSIDHDIEPLREMWASAWFKREKAMIAQAQPNEEGRGVFQHDKIEIGMYYELFVICCKDLWDLDDSEIALQPQWREVWRTQHSDLVLRENMNVDTKDKVGITYFTHISRLPRFFIARFARAYGKVLSLTVTTALCRSAMSCAQCTLNTEKLKLLKGVSIIRKSLPRWTFPTIV